MPDRARRSRRARPLTDREQRLRHPVALDHAPSEQLAEPLVQRQRQPGRAGHEQARAARNGAASAGSASQAAAIRLHIVGTPNTIVPPRRSGLADRVRVEPADVVRRTAAPERAERAEEQAVDVVERQRVHDAVAGRPRPRLVDGVEVGVQRRLRQRHALRRAGRPGRVDDQRAAPRAGGGTGGRRSVGPVEDQLGPGVGEDVRALGGRPTSGSAAPPRSRPRGRP